MGVISACLPSLRPLISFLFRGTVRGLGVSSSGIDSGIESAKNVGKTLGAWRNNSIINDREHFAKIEEPIHEAKDDRWGHDVEVQGGRGGKGPEDEISLEEMNLPDGAIKVKDEQG